MAYFCKDKFCKLISECEITDMFGISRRVVQVSLKKLIDVGRYMLDIKRLVNL